jgi:hypothetical protein
MIREVTGIRGWFLRLCFGLHWSNAEMALEDMKLNAISVPVTLKNLTTNEESSCYVVGGFHGVLSKDGMHKPVMSLSVIEDTKFGKETLDLAAFPANFWNHLAAKRLLKYQ